MRSTKRHGPRWFIWAIEEHLMHVRIGFDKDSKHLFYRGGIVRLDDLLPSLRDWYAAILIRRRHGRIYHRYQQLRYDIRTVRVPKEIGTLRLNQQSYLAKRLQYLDAMVARRPHPWDYKLI